MSTLRTTNIIHGSSAISNIVLDNQGRAIFGPDSPAGRAALYVNAQNNRVGVNTENPGVELDVDGQISATGNATIGGTLSVTGNISGDLNFNGNARIDSNGFFKAANGTAATPSLTFLNDPDNGLFRTTTNTLGFATAGNHRLDLSGAAGITNVRFQEEDNRIYSNSDSSKIRIFGGSFFSVNNGAALTLNGDTNATDPGIADLASSGSGFIRFRNSTNELAYMTRADGTVNIGFGLGIVPAKGGSFGGNQNVIHVGGSSAPQLRLQSSSSNQCDLTLIASNSGSDAEFQNANGGFNFRATDTAGGSLNQIASFSESQVTISQGRVALSGNDPATYESLDSANLTSGGDHRMKIRTLANGGGDPYLFFDAGGNNMIVGLHYAGSTSNRLVLGTGNTASGAVGIKVNGVGDAFADKRFLIGTNNVTGLNADNGLKVRSNAIGSQTTAAVALEGTGGDFYAIRYINSDITILSVSSSSPRLSYVGPTGVLFSIYQSGLLQTAFTYNNQLTGASRDVSVSSNGFLGFITSTRESKTNIESISDVSWLYSLNPVSFNYREKEEDNTFSRTKICNETMYGLIAEEVEPIAPELCYHDEDETLVGVEYRKLIPVLLAAVQEQKELIESLETRIATLENT